MCYSDLSPPGPGGITAGTDRVILDELHKEPDLLVAVKRVVDGNLMNSLFVLSGSTNLLLLMQVSEIMAGRAAYLFIALLALGEIHQMKPHDNPARLLIGEFSTESSLYHPPSDPGEILMRGMMSALLTLNNPQSWTRWWDGYIVTSLERDLSLLKRET